MKNSSLIKLVATTLFCAAPLAAQATTWTATLDIEDQRLSANWDDDAPLPSRRPHAAKPEGRPLQQAELQQQFSCGSRSRSLYMSI